MLRAIQFSVNDLHSESRRLSCKENGGTDDRAIVEVLNDESIQHSSVAKQRAHLWVSAMCEAFQRLILLVVRSWDGGWLRKDPDPGNAHH